MQTPSNCPSHRTSPPGQLAQNRRFTHVLILKAFGNDNPHPLCTDRITNYPELIAKCLRSHIVG